MNNHHSHQFDPSAIKAAALERKPYWLFGLQCAALLAALILGLALLIRKILAPKRQGRFYKMVGAGEGGDPSAFFDFRHFLAGRILSRLWIPFHQRVLFP